MQLIEPRATLALRLVIERKLEPARPPGMVGRRRVDVLAEVLIEHDPLRSEPVEGRRLDPVVAVAADVTQMQVIEADDDGASRAGRRRRWFFRIQLNAPACADRIKSTRSAAGLAPRVSHLELL